MQGLEPPFRWELKHTFSRRPPAPELDQELRREIREITALKVALRMIDIAGNQLARHGSLKQARGISRLNPCVGSVAAPRRANVD